MAKLIIKSKFNGGSYFFAFLLACAPALIWMTSQFIGGYRAIAEHTHEPICRDGCYLAGETPLSFAISDMLDFITLILLGGALIAGLIIFRKYKSSHCRMSVYEDHISYSLKFEEYINVPFTNIQKIFHTNDQNLLIKTEKQVITLSSLSNRDAVYNALWIYINVKKGNPNTIFSPEGTNDITTTTSATEFAQSTSRRFCFFFSLATAILGFMIMNNRIGGKIAGAALFFGMGWLFASLLMAAIKKINNKTLITLIEVLLVLLMLLFAITRNYTRYHRTEKYYDRYGNVHYTEDSRDEANQRYDIYDAADEYRKNH